jgi:hypothetical protein
MSKGNEAVGFVLAISVGLGFAIFFLATFAGALTGSAANALDAIVTGITGDVSTVIVPLIAIAFIALIYFVLKWIGVLKGGSKHKE